LSVVSCLRRIGFGKCCPDNPQLTLTIPVGVVGAVIGGAGINLVLSESMTDLNPWSFTFACVLAMVLLGLLEGGVGRK